MSLTKTILEDQEAGIDSHDVDREIDHACQSNANDNRPTDYDKKVEAIQEYMAGLAGDGWEEMTSKEWSKMMAHTINGLNGGELDRMENAAEIHQFGPDHVVRTGEGVYAVLSIIEFAKGAEEAPQA